MDGECKHPGCTISKIKALGYCNAHYLRNMRGLDMDKPVRNFGASDSERFWSKVNRAGECWVWTGARNNTGGYGIFRIGGRNAVAHRVAYTWANGPIPEGYEVDHMCFNRGCVNPEHLRLLTHQQNGQNRAGANVNSKSGVRGVYWTQDQWIARVCVGPETFEVGRFSELAEAERAVTEWRRLHMPVSLQDTRRAS